MARLVIGAEYEHFGDEWPDLLRREIDDADHAAPDELARGVALRDLCARSLDAEGTEIHPQLEGRAAGLRELRASTTTPTRMSTRANSSHDRAIPGNAQATRPGGQGRTYTAKVRGWTRATANTETKTGVRDFFV